MLKFLNYLESEETAAAKLALDKELEELDKNINGYINNFSYYGSSIQKMVADVQNNLIGGNKGNSDIDKVKVFFTRLAKVRPVRGALSTTPGATKSYLLIICILLGMMKNFNASMVGFLFEYFIAGILGKRVKLPVTNTADDIEYMTGSGGTYFQTKMLRQKGGDVEIKPDNVAQFFLDHPEYDYEAKQAQKKKMIIPKFWFIVGEKSGDYKILRIFIYEDFEGFYRAWKNGEGYKRTKAAVKDDILNAPLEHEFSVTINLFEKLQIIRNSITQEMFSIMFSAGEFVKELNIFFTSAVKMREQKGEKVRDKYKNVGKELRKANI